MKFSIVTVCRNNAATIAATIASVRAQSHVDLQHVFIDGASTDTTLSIIARDAAPHSIVVSEPDKGIYDAMNKGVARATGDVIGLLNADDHYKHNDVLKNVADAFAITGVDCVYGDVEYFRAEQPDRVVRRYDSGKFSRRALAIGLMPAHPATFFKRTVYQALGPFKTDYRISADFEFIVRAFKDGTLTSHYLNSALVRMQAGGVSSNGLQSKLVLNREILRALRENGVSSSYLHLAAKVPLRLWELLR